MLPKRIKNLQKIDARIKIPGSKSITNRAFVIAALANGKSVIHDILESDDTEYLLNALSHCGIPFNRKPGIVEITGKNGNFQPYSQEIFIGNAGTTMRFLTSLLIFGTGEYHITCDERMKERPIDDLTEALNQLGAHIDYVEKKGYPPLKIHGKKPDGGVISISGKKSSQFITSLLLIAPLLKHGLEINILDELVSQPYIDTTLQVMKDFGAAVENVDYKKFFIHGMQNYRPQEYFVQGDASSASYFLALPAITGGKIVIENLGTTCNQGDIYFANLLEKMGAQVKITEKSTEVFCDGRLKGIRCDLNSTPDIVQTLAMCALFAEGETLIENVGNLRIKETDRLAALENELKKIGASVSTGESWIKIVPQKNYQPATIKTYNDHRMAMCFAIAGTKIDGITIEDPHVVSKSFPNFWELLETLY